MPKPREGVGNSVPAELTAATYFTPVVLCDGRAVLGCCPSWQSKNGLLVTLVPNCGRSAPAPLTVASAVVQLCCVMVEMRLAAASWQFKNCLLRYSCTNSGKDVLHGCAGVGRFVPDPVLYRSTPVPEPDQPCTLA